MTILFQVHLEAQNYNDVWISDKIEEYKKDPRGPYKHIRWFCFDGRINPPKEPCGDNKGVQRAAYKDEVDALAEKRHVFLGQILANTTKDDIWDATNANSRLKQYQLEKFLKNADNGWVLRRAQYYRGAIQAEDEIAWGLAFFHWLLGNEAILDQQFFLVRQAAKHIPHSGESDKTQEMRAISKDLSEKQTSFMDLRVKIHGQPEASDIDAVQDYYSTHQSKLSSSDKAEIEKLIAVMKEVYKPITLESLRKYANLLPPDSQLKLEITHFIDQNGSPGNALDKVAATSGILCRIRESIDEAPGAEARLDLLDLSNTLELVLLRELPNVRLRSVKELLELTNYQAEASMGCGFMEEWEWDQVKSRLAVPETSEISLAALTDFHQTARSIVEWGTGMVRANYGEVIRLYEGFEPKASGFTDDLVRSSILLSLGESVGELGKLIAAESNMSNAVLDLTNQSSVRGVNPGFAMGELVVVTGSASGIDFSKDKIYIMEHPPADMKPVAGIATVSEGNMVSHVQLLARNLGIPNAVVSLDNVMQFGKYSGQQVFYAVSPGGRVVMKTASQMSQVEKDLVSEERLQRRNNRIAVPVEKVNLRQTTILNMRNVKAEDSGRLCGPKAANLGQLKTMFPDQVVEGFVIPFGIFRMHMDQTMKGQTVTFWEYLSSTFKEAETMRQSGKTDDEIETFTLGKLGTLREAILEMPLLPGFLADLEQSFEGILGGEMGEVSVFLRSDTNMEDLKEFTGAGLNLTLFNIKDPDKIVSGIKQVWASPYTERSFKWRQRYLLNPENVFPSILVIPGVNNDCSGVLITKGVTSGDPEDATIAFSRGVGGAVEGQMAETYLLKKNGENKLLSPAREPGYTVLLESGGTDKEHTEFSDPVLDGYKLLVLRRFIPELKRILPSAPGIETNGPFDVELGFKDNKLYLFQARPYVESKNATGSDYLNGLDPDIPRNKSVKMSRAL